MIAGRFGPAQSAEIKAKLGLSEHASLPVNGMSPRLVDGYILYVLPLNPLQRTYHRPHRVRAICPVCDKDISAGRIGQHSKTHR